MSLECLNALQKIELDILNVFKSICKQNNLKYFAIGGTALGAIRHNGFIPWDDDIDIGMPRTDYETFINIAKKLLPEEYYLLKPLEEYDVGFYSVPFCRICDKRYLLKMENQKVSTYVHAWFDIFPIETIPSSMFFKWFWVYTFLFLRLLTVYASFSKSADLNRTNRPIYEIILIKLGLFLKPERFFNRKFTFLLADNFVRLFRNNKNMSNYFIAWGAYKQNDVYPKKYFESGIEHNFEDNTVVLPKECDKYLKCIYRDYWKLPPEEQRRRHKIEIISFIETKSEANK